VFSIYRLVEIFILRNLYELFSIYFFYFHYHFQIWLFRIFLIQYLGLRLHITIQDLNILSHLLYLFWCVELKSVDAHVIHVIYPCFNDDILCVRIRMSVISFTITLVIPLYSLAMSYGNSNILQKFHTTQYFDRSAITEFREFWPIFLNLSSTCNCFWSKINMFNFWSIEFHWEKLYWKILAFKMENLSFRNICQVHNGSMIHEKYFWIF